MTIGLEFAIVLADWLDRDMCEVTREEIDHEECESTRYQGNDRESDMEVNHRREVTKEKECIIFDIFANHYIAMSIELHRSLVYPELIELVYVFFIEREKIIFDDILLTIEYDHIAWTVFSSRSLSTEGTTQILWFFHHLSHDRRAIDEPTLYLKIPYRTISLVDVARSNNESKEYKKQSK